MLIGVPVVADIVVVIVRVSKKIVVFGKNK